MKLKKFEKDLLNGKFEKLNIGRVIWEGTRLEEGTLEIMIESWRDKYNEYHSIEVLGYWDENSSKPNKFMVVEFYEDIDHILKEYKTLKSALNYAKREKEK